MRDALGRVLAADVISPIDVPGHDNSAMDGYAVRFADLKARRRDRARSGSARRSPASRSRARSAPGECVRIFTGGVMPQGADTVVMQERASEDASGVHVAPGALARRERTGASPAKT